MKVIPYIAPFSMVYRSHSSSTIRITFPSVTTVKLFTFEVTPLAVEFDGTLTPIETNVLSLSIYGENIQKMLTLLDRL